MISDIKVNYAIIGDLRDKIATYKSALETMEESLNNINSRLETENSGEAVSALISKHEDLKGDISACKGELEDLYKLFSGFHDEMTGIIHPMSYQGLMRVDRDDIWWNMQSIIGACTAIGIIRYNVSTYRSFPSFSDSKEEKENQERNYRKIEEIWDIINSYKSGFDSEIDYMNNLFNSKVVPYEEMDNNYASRAHETYTRYVTTWERIVDGITDFSQMVGNFVDGVIKSVEDLIKGLVGLVKGVFVYAVGAVAVVITKVTGDTPDWLKGAEEDFYKDNEMIKATLEDPSIIVEGIAQQVSDAKDEKGLAYCTGYTAGLIAQMVLLKKVKGGSGAEGSSNPKLKFNDVGEYYSYITDIGKRIDINSEQKLALIQEAYEALGNIKGDATCISHIKYLKPEGFGTNGRPIVDWPKWMGFDLDGIKGITRQNPLPNKWDRIGAINGENFTTLSNEGKIFSFDERAIPYLENLQARHIGNFNNDVYFDVIDAIKGNDINKLNSIMEKRGIDTVSSIEFKRLNSMYNNFINRAKVEIGNVDATYGLKGSAAPWKINGEIHMIGGAEQIVTPLTGDFLKRLGILNIEF